jgi:hypothetical protein
MSCPYCTAKSRISRRRMAGLAAAVLPAVLLALMPKCPMCVAAYVAAFTGIGLSLTAASYLRSAMILLCLVSLLVVTLSIGRRWAIARSKNRTKPAQE